MSSANKSARLRWGVEQRFEFIEFRLFWEGGINRSELIDFFGISVPQASKDLSKYQEIAPANLEYDRSQKRYLPSKSFKPVYFRPDATRYLSQLNSISRQILDQTESWSSFLPQFEAVPLPRRNVDAGILRLVLGAVRTKGAIEIEYQSMSERSSGPLYRWISPHAFGFDGMRWHTRAFCHIDKQFKDFVLSRILGVRAHGDSIVSAEKDWAWNKQVPVLLEPHPELTENKRAVVALDYGMENNQVELQVRASMLNYFLKMLNLNSNDRGRTPLQQHIILANRELIEQVMSEAREMELT